MARVREPQPSAGGGQQPSRRKSSLSPVQKKNTTRKNTKYLVRLKVRPRRPIAKPQQLAKPNKTRRTNTDNAAALKLIQQSLRTVKANNKDLARNAARAKAEMRMMEQRMLTANERVLELTEELSLLRPLQSRFEAQVQSKVDDCVAKAVDQSLGKMGELVKRLASDMLRQSETVNQLMSVIQRDTNNNNNSALEDTSRLATVEGLLGTSLSSITMMTDVSQTAAAAGSEDAVDKQQEAKRTRALRREPELRQSPDLSLVLESSNNFFCSPGSPKLRVATGSAASPCSNLNDVTEESFERRRSSIFSAIGGRPAGGNRRRSSMLIDVKATRRSIAFSTQHQHRDADDEGDNDDDDTIVALPAVATSKSEPCVLHSASTVQQPAESETAEPMMLEDDEEDNEQMMEDLDEPDPDDRQQRRSTSASLPPDEDHDEAIDEEDNRSLTIPKVKPAPRVSLHPNQIKAMPDEFLSLISADAQELLYSVVDENGRVNRHALQKILNSSSASGGEQTAAALPDRQISVSPIPQPSDDDEDIEHRTPEPTDERADVSLVSETPSPTAERRHTYTVQQPPITVTDATAAQPRVANSPLSPQLDPSPQNTSDCTFTVASNVEMDAAEDERARRVLVRPSSALSDLFGYGSSGDEDEKDNEHKPDGCLLPPADDNEATIVLPPQMETAARTARQAAVQQAVAAGASDSQFVAVQPTRRASMCSAAQLEKSKVAKRKSASAPRQSKARRKTLMPSSSSAEPTEKAAPPVKTERNTDDEPLIRPSSRNQRRITKTVAGQPQKATAKPAAPVFDIKIEDDENVEPIHQIGKSTTKKRVFVSMPKKPVTPMHETADNDSRPSSAASTSAAEPDSGDDASAAGGGGGRSRRRCANVSYKETATDVTKLRRVFDKERGEWIVTAKASTTTGKRPTSDRHQH